MGCCSRTRATIIAAFILSLGDFVGLITTLALAHAKANLIDRTAEDADPELGGAFYRIFYTKAEFCHESCFETTREKLFEGILQSTGCQSYYSAQDAALVFGGMAAIVLGVVWFVFALIIVFEPHRSLRLRQVVKLIYAILWVFLLISFFITIGLSYSIKCSSWDGPLSDRFQFRPDNLPQFGFTMGWFLISSIVWAVNERHIVTESEEALRCHTIRLGDPDGTFRKTSSQSPAKGESEAVAVATAEDDNEEQDGGVVRETESRHPFVA